MAKKKKEKKTYHKKCAVCGKEFDTFTDRQIYCSSQCRLKAQVGVAKKRCSPSLESCLNCAKKECTYAEKPTEEEMDIIKDANLGENLLTVEMKVGGYFGN